jgi:hypothetical protein
MERRLLRGLWHAPELLDEARAELQVTDFEDAGARSLAGWWWEHGVALPEGDGEVAALARELASSGREQDQRAEVLGAIRRLVVRRLQRELRARRSGLAAASGESAERLMQEIQDIARTLQKLST